MTLSTDHAAIFVREWRHVINALPFTVSVAPAPGTESALPPLNNIGCCPILRAENRSPQRVRAGRFAPFWGTLLNVSSDASRASMGDPAPGYHVNKGAGLVSKALFF